ncbi:DUF2273 domain-containing protein [Microcoleus sp. LEGE 07076]|uniref:DUF2273 domain-containing protein n=1 Tax=Microcoleus sp. LEGE 07076 TaxID=915322 RepID=UPI001881B530|nr:DUF2273 domain-containing protein [Microcoleus sp. LEGE 07076]MBE9188059.1 DUF2273 domain-containing protein [Microcoleus sp. LEGE 07076]
MTAQPLSLPQANLKMALWQVDADSMSSSELYVWLNDSGLPHEVTIRLHELASYTKKAGNKVLAVGKIVLIQIIEFVKAHPNLATGIALGAAVGLLASSVPFIGPVLAPLAAVLGITVGAIAGHRLDQGYRQVDGIVGVTQDFIQIARLFFQLLIDVFNAVFRNVITA